MFAFWVCYFVFTFLSKKVFVNFASHFVMLIYLNNLTYCHICDRYLGYQDTDLAYLTHIKVKYTAKKLLLLTAVLRRIY